MEMLIYVTNEQDMQEAELAFETLMPMPEGKVVRGVNLAGTQPVGVPSEVLQVMMLKKINTFPLTVIDGKPIVSGRIPSTEELRHFFTDGAEGPAILVNRADSAVDFPTKSRIHISLDVRDVEASKRFYTVFFGQEPTKVRPDYAKFELTEPPLNIALNQFHEPAKGGPINHLGIQVKSSDAVLEAKERYEKAGFIVEEELSTACCYAVQTKIWIGDPDGNRWEVYVVTGANADEGCGPDCICFQELQPSYAKTY